MTVLVSRRQALLVAIGRYWTEHAYGPSYRDLTELLGIHGKASVSERLTKAAAAGHVHYDEGVSRSVHLSPSGWAAIGLSASTCGERCKP